MTTNDTIHIPTGFTKGSGKKILEALAEHGWEIIETKTTDWLQMVNATFTGGAITERSTAVYAEISVNPSGSYRGASGMNHEGLYVKFDETVSGMISQIKSPMAILRSHVEAAARAQRANDRKAIADAVKEQYLLDTADGTIGMARRALQRIADAPIDYDAIAKRDRYGVDSILSTAFDIAKQVAKRDLAAKALYLEGRARFVGDHSNEYTVVTLAEAIESAVREAMTSMNCTERSAKVVLDAITDIRYYGGYAS